MHRHCVRPAFGFENPVMAVLAIEPFRMRPMRESHHWHPGRVFHNDIAIQDLDFRFREDIGPRPDHAGPERRGPVDMVALTRPR